MRRFEILLMFLFIFGMLACAGQDPAVAEFEANQPRISEAVTNAAAASYFYRLAETPEEQVMQEILARIARGQATHAEIKRAIETEDTRRTKYIDGLDREIENARAVLADLSRTANAIRDAELRDSARAIAAHYNEILQLCSRIARAQRARSSSNRTFLEDLAAKREITEDYGFAKADAEVKEARSRLEQITGNDKLLTAQFVGVKQRKTGRPLLQ